MTPKEAWDRVRMLVPVRCGTHRPPNAADGEHCKTCEMNVEALLVLQTEIIRPPPPEKPTPTTFYLVVKKLAIQENVLVLNDIVAAYTFKTMAELRCVEEDYKPEPDDGNVYVHEAVPVSVVE